MALAVSLICGLAFGVHALQAQDIKRITYGETGFDDIVAAMEAIDIKIYKINLPVDENESFNTTLIIDEYKEGEQVNTNSIPLFIPTMQKIKYRGETEYTTKAYDRMTFIFNDHDPDMQILKYICPDIMSGNYTLIRNEKKDGDGNERRITYHTRPFRLQEFTPGKEIPILLYGSMWLDEKYNIYRFCGSSEVDAEMEDELFKLSPHYFVIKLKLDPNPDFTIDVNQQ